MGFPLSSHDDRRSTNDDGARFRSTIDELLKKAGSLPRGPSDEDLEPFRRSVDEARERFRHNPVLDHKLRNIAAVTTLSRNLATPDEAVVWIRSAIRSGSP